MNTNHFSIAEETLLAPYDLAPYKLERVFSQLMSHQVDFADLYFQYARSEAWSLEEGIVKSGSFNIEQGVGVRAIAGEKTAFAYSDDISLGALQTAAGTTRAIAAGGAHRLAPALRHHRTVAVLELLARSARAGLVARDLAPGARVGRR